MQRVVGLNPVFVVNKHNQVHSIHHIIMRHCYVTIRHQLTEIKEAHFS